MLALALLLPVPTIGVIAGLAEDGGLTSRIIFFVCKAWILALPVVWHVMVDRDRDRGPRFSTRGLGVGAALGVAIAAVIVGGYVLLGDQLVDPAAVAKLRDKASDTGLDSPLVFTAFFSYLCLVNSILEEYVWRWFVYRKCRDLVARITTKSADSTTLNAASVVAIVVAALCFTLHHTVALALQTNVTVTVLASVGVFIGGAVWSWCYLKYQSIWAGWISHVIADIAVAIVAWQIIMG